jgi:tRNA U34 5-methylaminomethyl-2-thiouridine-forming methyltransferase MnmC
MAVVRKQILLEAAQNKRLKKLREKTGRSESEIIRRALDVYEANGESNIEDSAELTELVQALKAQNAKTKKALATAEREVKQTLDYFTALRAEREHAHPKPTKAKTQVAA